MNAVFWIIRTGAPWRDLPLEFGDWKNTNRRFCRWRDRGIWEKLLEIVMIEPDYEWIMIDATHMKVHPHAAGAVGGYGAAQRLYIKRGYIPDGKGVTYNYEPTIPGNSYPLDDELVLWFTKKLK